MEKEIFDKKEKALALDGAAMASQETARRKVASPKIENNGCLVARTLAGNLHFDEYGNPIGIAH